tara:strand:- start:997 stop:4308 length:3312 start_codon:yes stop_codon:yes gene_type:complete
LVAGIGYLNRVRLVNDTLELLVEPYTLTLESIEFYPLGEVRVEGLTLSPRKSSSGHPLVSIPEVQISYDFMELKQSQKLKTIHLSEPLLSLNNDHLDATSSKEGSKGPKFDLASLAFFTESFSITDGQIEVDLDGMPKVRSEWQFHTGPIEFDEEQLLRELLTLHLNNLVIGEKGTIDEATVALRISRDLNTLSIDSIEIEGLDLEITPDWIAAKAPVENAHPGGKQVNSTGLNETSNPIEVHLRQLRVGESSIKVAGFDGNEGRPSIPAVAFETRINAEDIHFSDGKWSSESPVSLALNNLTLGESNAQLLSADSIKLEAESLGAIIEDHDLGRITVMGIDVMASDASLSFLQSEDKKEQADDPALIEPAPEEFVDEPWVVSQLDIKDGSILLRDATFGEKNAPQFETRIEAMLKRLSFGRDGFESDAEQTIRLEQTRLWPPGVSGAESPLLSLNRSEVVGRWSEFKAHETLQRLFIRGLRINFTDESLGEWIKPISTSGTSTPIDPTIYKVTDFNVTGGNLIAESSFAEGIVPKIYSDFSAETLSGEGVEPFAYRIALQNFKLRNHPIFYEAEGPPAPDAHSPVAEEEVISAKSIEVFADATRLQRDRSLDKIKVSGATLRVGEGLNSIVESSKTSSEQTVESMPSLEGALPSWLIDEIEITQSQVMFEKLIPQIEGIEFAIETRLHEVPLSLDGLLAQDKLQKVELAGLEIKDPYNSFITVASLPTIFVQFSLSGLAQQEVERVDLISPSLFVGQGLFWWIDYQRNFRMQNEGASIGLEEGGPLTDDSPPGIPEAEEKEPTGPDWIIKTIEASAGKIVIAPTGVPLGMVPFPFNATTNMQGGGIELSLDIPNEDHVYDFPDYKVKLYGLTGEVLFNVPVEQVDNNVVQTFELSRAVWKDHEATNIYLDVTFDSKGVYGKLGGEAYGGYAEAGFNFYLDDPGKWDGWIAGTNFDTGPLTNVLVPDNFLMDGKVSLKLISEGRDKELGETTGEFLATTPGWFDVTKFDKILDELPSEWTNLQRSLSELGLIGLKRFDYDQGTGNLYLLGQEGDLQLQFEGDYGTRELKMHLHDDRNRQEDDNDDSGSDQTPEAAVRPVASNL